MIAPVKRLLKREVDWLGTNRCKHYHSYLEHYHCYISEAPPECPFVEKVGYLDIEATNLKATFGYVFSYAIKARGEDKMYGRVLTQREIRGYKFDANLMQEFTNDIKNFHRICVYYGTHFDVPFLRTRCIKHGVPFPEYQDLYISDVYYMVKNKLQLHRNRLENACQFFDIPSKEHRLNPDVWNRAGAGDTESLEYIWEHNKEDVIALESLHGLLENYSKRSKVSI